MTARSRPPAFAAFRDAMGFLTVLLPGARAGAPGPASRRWFGPVGAIVGAVTGLAVWGAAQWWPPLVVGVVLVIVDLALTGLLHADGLADCGDGLLPPMGRERRLAVMKAPDVGAFGVATLVVVLLLRTAAGAALPEAAPGWRSVAVLASLWALSRATAVLTMRMPYARGVGLASAFLAATGGNGSAVAAGGSGRPAIGDRSAVLVAIVAIVAGIAVPAALSTGGARLAGVAAAIAACGPAALARRRIGGFTGDVLGAQIICAETIGLLCLAVR